MSSRQDVNQFLQVNHLKEDCPRMRQFIEFAKCQKPEFDGDVYLLTLEEISIVTPLLIISFTLSLIAIIARN